MPLDVKDVVKGITNVCVKLLCSTVLPLELKVAVVAGVFSVALVVT